MLRGFSPFKGNPLSPEFPAPSSGSVLVVSDTHLRVKHADTAALYEMLTRNDYRLLVINGDFVDGWEGSAFTPLQICTLDLLVRLQEEQGLQVIYNEGNHNEKEALRHVAEAAADVNLTISPGILIETPDNQRTITLHGHQFDSRALWEKILDFADNEYRRLSENGPGDASSMKLWVKRFMGAMGYDDAYRHAAGLYEADRVLIGHHHTPERMHLSFQNSLGSVLHSLTSVFRRAGGELSSSIPVSFISNCGQHIQAAAMRKTVDRLLPHLPRIAGLLAHERNIHARRLASVFQKCGFDWLGPVIHYAETQPDLSCFSGLTAADLRPSYSGTDIPGKKPNPRQVEFIDEGSWIDGNATYGLFDQDGRFHLIDWSVEREKRGLGPKPDDAELLRQHHERYGTRLHPLTLARLSYYDRHVRDKMPSQDRAEHYALPDHGELWHIQIDSSGAAHLIPPGAVPPATAARDESAAHSPAAPVPVAA